MTQEIEEKDQTLEEKRKLWFPEDVKRIVKSIKRNPNLTMAQQMYVDAISEPVTVKTNDSKLKSSVLYSSDFIKLLLDVLSKFLYDKELSNLDDSDADIEITLTLIPGLDLNEEAKTNLVTYIPVVEKPTEIKIKPKFVYNKV